MYSQNLYFAEDRIQPDYELIADGKYSKLRSSSCTSQFFGSQQQPWTPGLCSELLRQDNIGPERSSSMSSFQSPISAFYTDERSIRFPQYESLRADSDMEFPLYRSSCETSLISSGDPSGQSCGYNNSLLWRQISVPGEIHDPKVSSNSYDYTSVQPMRLSSPQVKQPFRLTSASNNSNSSAGMFSVSTGSVLPSKTRIRWTQDLHEKFVECVNRLGGAEKATPKAILKLMDNDGLTIFHVKSHLQKYRIAKYIPDSAEGRKASLDEAPRLNLKGGLQIKEALQLQLDVQRQLHEQLEIQRKLQLRIEEQGKQLKMMFDQQQKTTKQFLSSQNNISIDEDLLPEAEGSEKTHFPSKIS